MVFLYHTNILYIVYNVIDVLSVKLLLFFNVALHLRKKKKCNCTFYWR